MPNLVKEKSPIDPRATEGGAALICLIWLIWLDKA